VAHLFGQADMEIRKQEGARGAVRPGDGFLLLGDMAAQLVMTRCSGLPASCNMPVSMIRRAENASMASAAEGWTTYQPLRAWTWTKPRACSASALRAPRCG
jgi:hypothetical protein